MSRLNSDRVHSPGGVSVELTGNAVETDVLLGKEFYSDDPEVKKTGSLVPNATVYYSGFGQLCGTNDDGGQTFTGYGRVRGVLIENTLQVSGEVLIASNTNSQPNHFYTGISIANCITALGLTPANYTYKGDFYNYLDVFYANGVKMANDDGHFGYGFLSEHNNGILNCARYYTTEGGIGGWPTNDHPYVPGVTWLFSFVMDVV